MKFKVGFFLLGCVLSSQSYAATELETEYLIELVSQMNVATMLATEASLASSESCNKKGEYKKLQRDIREFKVALERHVNSPSERPRVVNPLYLDYQLTCNAITAIEREYLSQLVAHIDIAKHTAVQAKQASSTEEVISLNYKGLLWDFSEFQVEVQRNLSQFSSKPRSVNELAFVNE